MSVEEVTYRYELTCDVCEETFWSQGPESFDADLPRTDHVCQFRNPTALDPPETRLVERE